MDRARAWVRCASLVLVAVVFFAACGKTFLYGVRGSAGVQSVYVQTFFTSLLPGTHSLFRLYAILTDGSTRALESPPTGWRSSDGSVAAVDASGNVRFLKTGRSVISGSDPQSGLSADAPVAILGSGFTSLSVSCPSFTLPWGFAEHCRAELVFDNQATAEATEVVSWSVTNGAGQATISNAGGQRGRLVGVFPGGVTVTAAIGGLSAQTAVQITNESLSAIALSPPGSTVGVGGAIAFSARATFSSGSALDVTRLGRWSSGNPAILGIDAATGAGTAGTPGTVTVGFVVAGDIGSGGSASATTGLNVVAPALSIAFSPDAMALVSGQQAGFRVTALYPGGIESDVTYSSILQSDDPAIAIATVGVSDPPGVVAALAPGRTTIRASFAGLSATLPVIVATPSLVGITGIAIVPPLASAPVGHAVTFRATASYSDGSSNDVTQLCLWTHSSPDVSVSNSIPKGIAIGAAGPDSSLIGCHYGGVEGSATLNITAVSLVAMSVTPENATTSLGSPLQFVATGSYSDGTVRNITDQVAWSSANGAIATIDANGLATPIGMGSTAITAALGPVSDTHLLTVDGTAVGNHRIFVTSQSYTVDQIGSLAGADAICATVASNGMLGGTWRAVLSDSVQSAAQRLRVVGPVYNLAPTPQLVAGYAGGVSALWSGSLVNPPSYTETGDFGGAATWTGTMSNGTSGSSCAGWTDPTPMTIAIAGGSSSTNGSWLAATGMPCDSSARLYCIDGQGPFDLVEGGGTLDGL